MKKLMLFFLLAGLFHAATGQTDTEQAEKIYLEGLEIHNKAEQTGDRELDRKAEDLFKKAIELDSANSPAFVQLGWIHFAREQRNFWEDGFLDSALYFAKKALHFDKESAGVYGLLGMLYQQKGKLDKSLEAYKSALLYNPDQSNIYGQMGGLYFNNGDYLKAVECLFKQQDIDKNSGDNIWTLGSLYNMLTRTGYMKESHTCNEKILKLNNDSSAYKNRILFCHFISGDFDSVIELAKEYLKDDPANVNSEFLLGWANLYKDNYDKSCQWFKKAVEETKARGQQVNPNEGYGFACLQKGMKEEADFHLKGSVQNATRLLEANYYPEVALPHLVLAAVFSAKGEKEKALEHLKKNKSTHLQALNYLKFNPMFDNIRDEPEFQTNLKEVETKYEEVHQSVGKFLAER
jgi:tetratricopeptide (TPR) repeat protein